MPRTDLTLNDIADLTAAVTVTRNGVVAFTLAFDNADAADHFAKAERARVLLAKWERRHADAVADLESAFNVLYGATA